VFKLVPSKCKLIIQISFFANLSKFEIEMDPFRCLLHHVFLESTCFPPNCNDLDLGQQESHRFYMYIYIFLSIKNRFGVSLQIFLNRPKNSQPLF